MTVEPGREIFAREDTQCAVGVGQLAEGCVVVDELVAGIDKAVDLTDVAVLGVRHEVCARENRGTE